MINCRICIRRSVQNYGRVLWSRVPVHDTHRSLFSILAPRARHAAPGPACESPLPRVTFHIYIYPTQRLPRAAVPLQSRARPARPGTPHNFSRPTRYSTGDRPHEHTPRPTPQWQCFCPTAHCPHSLSAPPGHRALTETPARDVVEIWPRRRPGARARPLRPLCRESPAVSRGLRPSSRPPRSRRAGIARAGRTPARRHASLCPAPWSGPAPRTPRPGTGRVAGS